MIHWRLHAFLWASLAMAAAIPAASQQAPSAADRFLQRLQPYQLPGPADEQKGVTIGWHSMVSVARDKALLENKPLIVFHFSGTTLSRRQVDRAVQQILPCRELNALAGRAIFATETSDDAANLLVGGLGQIQGIRMSSPAVLVSVDIPDGGQLRRVRSFHLPDSAIETAANLSPFVGPVEPTAAPRAYGNEHPWSCLPSGAGGANALASLFWAPPVRSLPPPIKAELKPPALYERFRASVFVLIARGGASGDSQGSAVAVTPDLLLTNCHVVEGASRYAVVSTWSDSRFCPATLVTADTRGDRCWIRLDRSRFGAGGATPESADAATCVAARSIPAGVRPVSDLKVGESVFAIGTPVGLSWTLTTGVISQIRDKNGIRQIQTDAPITHGSSGGALFDSSGNLIGITSWGIVADHAQGLNFAIAAEDFFKP